LTYGGQGTLKKGVHARHHAVIYTEKPHVMSKEKLTKKPIRMDPYSKRDKLDQASRINYGKLYTVEHNVKVSFIGQIAKKHEHTLVSDYNITHPPVPEPAPYEETFPAVATTYAGGQSTFSGYTANPLVPLVPGSSSYQEPLPATYAAGQSSYSSRSYPQTSLPYTGSIGNSGPIGNTQEQTQEGVSPETKSWDAKPPPKVYSPAPPEDLSDEDNVSSKKDKKDKKDKNKKK